MIEEQSDESEKERIDRELIELLNELRVALPGVQVLFAFLLVVPFQQRFATVTSFQKTTYFVTLLLAAVSCAFLIAPSAHHRILFRARGKLHLLITDFLYGTTTTIIVTVAAAGVFAALWYALPLSRR